MSLDFILKYVGRKVATIRKERALTQVEAAREAGISYRYFQNIESGAANMTISTLLRLAQFFGVSVADFFPQKNQIDNL